MKKIILVLTLVTLMISIVGCKKRSSDTEYKYMYSEGNYIQRLTASTEGYYFVNGFYLYYCDYETMEPVVLCNKPNCLHDKELDETKKTNCNAFLITEDDLLLTTYNNYLYCYVGLDFLKAEWEPELIRISLDGSERKTVSVLEPNITSMALHNEKLYYATTVISDDKEEAEKGIFKY